ncbi:hypothetical protein KSC_104280 [Ktedonobacter sp. SOSP1-52]|uniref:hypothetical protein n=1 Tax=Ktedonobacter sp. SOSP1-52 TaxID=2778366 RepID=UPI0019169766|nr:hypothetical protein [Ktedonobacter sp. SOSP1-52]GHO71536.1 hypothetical protein KSC_104280 [Ktedonobacter sp. SOSP1-52]
MDGEDLFWSHDDLEGEAVGSGWTEAKELFAVSGRAEPLEAGKTWEMADQLQHDKDVVSRFHLGECGGERNQTLDVEGRCSWRWWVGSPQGMHSGMLHVEEQIELRPEHEAQ